MLTHGYGDGAYTHYSTALWPADLNFTISSLCRVLRALERSPVKQSRELFLAPPQNSFFDSLLHRKSQCFSSIPSLEGFNVVPFPPPGTSNCSTSEETLPSARQLHEGQQEQICHGLLLVAYSQGYFQGGHRGISCC
jgi:hypothetical protein